MFKFVLLLLVPYSFAKVHPSTRGDVNPMVRTPLGPVKGSLLQTILGKPIYTFRGIRYAKPPTNELRFQPPVPVEPWTEVYDATNNGAVCPQPTQLVSSEDCLLLNVYTTMLPNKRGYSKRPVIAYIHGGGYYIGGATTEWGGPQYLLDEPIVLVGLQYRLGSLGFISTGDRLAPGNLGLKDQVAALKWIKNNIAAFGGDPDQVTLFGFSSGSASVSLHVVSPMSKGLFQRAILMSGSNIGNWPVPREQFSLAQKQAGLVGCPNDTSLNIINCLKTKSASEIANTISGFAEFANDPIIIWLPVVENDFGQERFLTDHPAKLIQCGNFQKVPVLISTTRNEFDGSADVILGNPSWLQTMNDNFDTVAPISFIYERGTPNSIHISTTLKQFYFGGSPISNQTRSGLQELYTDAIIGFSVHRNAELLASKSTKNVYFYLFDIAGHTFHGGDGMYLQPPPIPYINATDDGYKIVTKLITIYKNFATFGNPTPTITPILDNLDWKPYTTSGKKYMDFSDKLTMAQNLFTERYNVWDQLFPIQQCQRQRISHSTRKVKNVKQ